MDTDDLSEEAYKAIIIEAEKFNHDLTLRFGLLSYQCDDENEYVDKSVQLIHKMKKLHNYEIDDMFFGDPPNKRSFHAALERILKNIEELKKIPPGNRTYPTY